MFDRRLVTDVGLALLIALPSVLPAAPGPWTSDDQVSKGDSPMIEAPASHGEWVRVAQVDHELSPQRQGRS